MERMGRTTLPCEFARSKTHRLYQCVHFPGDLGVLTSDQQQLEPYRYPSPRILNPVFSDLPANHNRRGTHCKKRIQIIRPVFYYKWGVYTLSKTGCYTCCKQWYTTGTPPVYHWYPTGIARVYHQYTTSIPRYITSISLVYHQYTTGIPLFKTQYVNA